MKLVMIIMRFYNAQSTDSKERLLLQVKKSGYDMHNEREKFLNIFSANLRAQRRKKGYTQEQLSELAGISYKYYQELEGGKKVPSVIMLLRLCKALNVRFDDLIKLKKCSLEQRGKKDGQL